MASPMRTRPIAGLARPVSTLGLGMMRIEAMSDAAITTLVNTGREAGIDLIDHADIYGTSLHACERRFAEAMRLTPSQRDELVIQTKCGIVPADGTFDFSAAHILESVEGSLRALQTEHIDILLLHRPDALVQPDEVASAFDELHAAGKVLAFGVSNHTPRQIELLQRSVRQKLAVNQVQLSLLHAGIIAQGVAMNIADEPQAVTVDGGGIVDYCRLNDIALQAWSPFQGPNGVFLGSSAHPELNAEIDRVAAAHGVEPIAVATAWITRHPAEIQVVLGTTSPARVTDAAPGADLPLTRAQWYGLFRAAGYLVP